MLLSLQFLLLTLRLFEKLIGPVNGFPGLLFIAFRQTSHNRFCRQNKCISVIRIHFSCKVNEVYTIEKLLGSVQTELLAIALAMQKWVEYPFLAMTANANAIAKSSVWMEPYWSEKSTSVIRINFSYKVCTAGPLLYDPYLDGYLPFTTSQLVAFTNIVKNIHHSSK